MHPWHVLDQMVLNLCSKAPLLPTNCDNNSHPFLLREAVSETNSLRFSFLQEAITCKSKKELKILVSTYQAVISDMSNKLTSAITAAGTPSNRKKATPGFISDATALQQHLLTLLAFLEIRFPHHFDTSQSMPQAYAADAALFVKSRLSVITKGIEQHLPSPLVLLILKPFCQFVDRYAQANHTYRHFILLRNYSISLENNLHRFRPQNHLIPLLETFIILNYCPDGFLEYFFSSYSATIAGEYAPSEHKEAWSKLLTIVSRFHVCDPENENIPVLKSTVVATIMHYIASVPASEQGTPGAILKDQLGLKTSLSVAQIALFMRILVDTGMIHSKNQSMLLRQVASILKASKSEAISPESLRVKFYDIDPSTINSVKDYVILLMNKLRTY